MRQIGVSILRNELLPTYSFWWVFLAGLVLQVSLFKNWQRVETGDSVLVTPNNCFLLTC